MERLSRILLIRHGQTTINAENKLSGHTDPPLTEKGLAQCDAVAETLSSMSIDRVISSPLQRTSTMAEKIAARQKCEVELIAGFKEQNFGTWEGKTFPEIFNLVPGGPKGLMRGPFLARFPEGEGTEDFVARVMKTYRDLVMDIKDGKTIALVTHYGVIVVLLSHFLGIDPFLNFFRIRVDAASVSMVDRYDLGLYHMLFINRV